MGKISRILRRLFSRILGKPWNFSWVINGKLAGCSRPESKNDLIWLKNQGVESIVNLTEYPIPNEWIKKAELGYMHESINDHMAPSVEQIDKIISFIHDEISKKRPVTVHCAAGQGRTGTILASYILKHLGLNADKSITKIRKLRPPSIERSQEKSLYLYESYLQKTKGV